MPLSDTFKTLLPPLAGAVFRYDLLRRSTQWAGLAQTALPCNEVREWM